MIEVWWEYEVMPESAAEFVRHYSAGGTWAQLFRRDPAYRGTVLLRDAANPLRFATRDLWDSRAAYDAFRTQNAAEYERVDAACDLLTASERLVGIFEVD